MAKGYTRDDKMKRKAKKGGKIDAAKAEYFEGKDIEKDEMKKKRSLAC